MTTLQTPDDQPDFTAIETYLAAHSQPTDSEAPAHIEGRTRRVRRLSRQVAEAQQLAHLQSAPVLTAATTRRLHRTRRAAAEATALVALRQEAAFTALSTTRTRRLVTTTGLIALTAALGWSTAGVHTFAADNAPPHSTRWWLAWAVEPCVSLALLTIVIARAHLAARGRPLHTPIARRIEWLLLMLTLLMNTWPYLPLVTPDFRFQQLLIHTIGPTIAVSIITVLPHLWHAIDHPPPAAHTSSTASQHRDAGSLDRVHRLIATGELPARPSANQIRTALRCGMDTARRLRDNLRTNSPEQP